MAGTGVARQAAEEEVEMTQPSLGRQVEEEEEIQTSIAR